MSTFPRLLEILRPKGGGVFVLHEGYFDESGDLETGEQVFCISGYYLEAEQARLLDAEWKAALAAHGLPYFHMVDCAHGSGEFARFDKSERILIATKFIELIKAHTLAGFSALLNAKHFEASEKYPDGYSAAASLCVTALNSFLETHRISSDIAYFFEAGHKSKGRAYRHVADKLQKFSASLTFARKEEVRLLQAADILAWQTAKYAKDGLSGKRKPRKDFLSLMEHVHTLAFMTIIKDGASEIGIEEWPLSRRSPHTTAMSLDQSGPVTFLFEDGNNTPIIPVESTNGWRLGGGQLGIVELTDIGRKTFALALEERRLHELIANLTAAASDLWGDNKAPVFRAEDISAIEHVDGDILKFHLPIGSIHVQISNELAAKLMAALKKG